MWICCDFLLTSAFNKGCSIDISMEYIIISVWSTLMVYETTTTTTTTKLVPITTAYAVRVS